jgi:hypothetical protein
MATTPLTTQAVTIAGLTPSFTAAGGIGAGNGFTFTNDGSTYFRIKNASGGSLTATVKSGVLINGVTIADQTFTVGATTGDVTWSGSPVMFGTTTTIEVSASASITAAVFK